MNKLEIKRRQFIQLLLTLSASPALSLSAWPAKSIDTDGQGIIGQKKFLSPEESLKKLLILLGPWPEDEKDRAEDFARRFLKAENTVSPYLPGSSSLIQSLAGRFPDEACALGEINIKDIPAEERELLLELTKQIYSHIEVRFYVSKEPDWGECQDDPLWHTQTPRILNNKKI